MVLVSLLLFAHIAFCKLLRNKSIIRFDIGWHFLGKYNDGVNSSLLNSWINQSILNLTTLFVINKIRSIFEAEMQRVCDLADNSFL